MSVSRIMGTMAASGLALGMLMAVATPTTMKQIDDQPWLAEVSKPYHEPAIDYVYYSSGPEDLSVPRTPDSGLRQAAYDDPRVYASYGNDREPALMDADLAPEPASARDEGGAGDAAAAARDAAQDVGDADASAAADAPAQITVSPSQTAPQPDVITL